MRTATTVTLGIMMALASSCSSSCSPRECVAAMDAYARAAQAAPHDEDDHAYDEFVALAARSPKDGGGSCRAVAALSAQVAIVRAQRAAARSAARATIAPPPTAPTAEPHANAAHDDANAAAAAAAADDAHEHAGADDEHEHEHEHAGARTAAADDADDAADDDDDERSSAHSFSVASSPNAVGSPVNVSQAVARAQASSSVYVCSSRCVADQRSCLDRCDKAWKAGRSLGEYRECQARCSDVEVACRRACAPRRRAADGGPE